MRRSGAWLVLLFVLVHKIGDTLSQLTVRLLFNDLGYANDEIALYDVGFGFWAFLVGIFVGGILYTKLGLKRSVLIALVLMGVSNLSFALLAASGHSNAGLAGAMGFENFASGYGGAGFETRALSAGVNRILKKPYRMSEIAEVLADFFATKG